jgi:hypothetical protein
MLTVLIPDIESFDNKTQEFVTIKGTTLQLEHSLVSISKWESKWHKPFLNKDPKTREELIDYVRCMTITQNVNPLVFDGIPNSVMKKIREYMDDAMTATTIKSQGKGKNGSEQITSELIYYWMVALEIPFECQKWHINRLLTLIRVCDIKNKPPKKMSKRETLQQNARLNAMRRKRHNTKG